MYPHHSHYHNGAGATGATGTTGTTERYLEAEIYGQRACTAIFDLKRTQHSSKKPRYCILIPHMGLMYGPIPCDTEQQAVTRADTIQKAIKSEPLILRVVGHFDETGGVRSYMNYDKFDAEKAAKDSEATVEKPKGGNEGGA